MHSLAPSSVRALLARWLHQAQPAMIAEYQLETVRVTIESSEPLVKWNEDTLK